MIVVYRKALSVVRGAKAILGGAWSASEDGREKKSSISKDGVEKNLAEIRSALSGRRTVSYLGRDLCLVETKWGGHVVVPAYNVDVAVGIIRDGIHEPWTTRLVQESLKLGDVYVNVGANFGYYTSLGGLIVGDQGRVFSFEANPTVFAVLLKTIMYAGIPNRTTAFNRAVFSTTGSTMGFSFDYQFAGGGHLEFFGSEASDVREAFWSPATIPYILDGDGRWIPTKGIMNSFETHTVALDDVLGDVKVNLLHCDVESAEPYVIRGARKLIANSPLIRIVFEWSSHNFNVGSDEYRAAVREMWDFLAEEGFSIRRLLPFLYPDGAIKLSPQLSYAEFTAGEHGDYLAVRLDT
ncbi:MAG: FkbM family methyltransferase [Mesorhizobium sp.]|nr:MAG: FkbM family methyltransferase [Mesorhizobium sp.]TIO11886.1 MAG: FkbM family methyltransferase [Mesorhizobium sp.]